MRKIEVKPLVLKEEGSWLQRTMRSKHFRKSMLFIAIGGVAGFLYYYYTIGQHNSSMPMQEVLKSVFTGAFFGFFITNSPCARGKC